MSAHSKVLFGLVVLLMMGAPPTARSEIAIPQITDITGVGLGFGDDVVNIWASPAGAPFQVDDTAVFLGNDIVVYTMDGPSAGDGAGLSISLSNGDSGLDPANPNLEPPHPVFTTIGNASGRLENGNAIRFSMWMRQDPANPVTVAPQIEPVVKMELWKSALSGDADFNPGPFPTFGDRIWDTDQNASDPIYDGRDQSRASWVDMNNSGTTSFGNPVATSLVTDEWRLVESFLVVDDDPLDDGFGWSIGSEFFDVTHVEEIRAVMFLGDFAGTDLTEAGSIWVDNLMLEVFATEADMLATPNSNTAPIEGVGLIGDFNDDGSVDAADYTVWRDGLETMFTTDQYDEWKTNFGATSPGAGALTAGAVPEPGAGVLLILAVAGGCLLRRPRAAVV